MKTAALAVRPTVSRVQMPCTLMSLGEPQDMAADIGSSAKAERLRSSSHAFPAALLLPSQSHTYNVLQDRVQDFHDEARSAPASKRACENYSVPCKGP
jgi:hypothetical protein